MNHPYYLSDLIQDWDALESYADWLYKKEDEEEIPDEEPDTFLD